MPTLKPTNEMQTCDLCGRLIVPGQVMCPCGARVSAPAAAPPVDGRDLTWLLWAVPAAGLAWVIYRIIAPGDLLFSFIPLFKIYAVVAIASAATAAVLADRAARVQPAGTEVGLPPVGWFFAVLMLWPVAFPIFVWNQLQEIYPGKARLALGAAGLFFAAILWANFVTRRQPPANYFPEAKRPAAAAPGPARPRPGVAAPPAQSPPGAAQAAAPPAASAAPRVAPAAVPPQPRSASPASAPPAAAPAVLPPQQRSSGGGNKGQPKEESYGVEILKKK